MTENKILQLVSDFFEGKDVKVLTPIEAVIEEEEDKEDE